MNRGSSRCASLQRDGQEVRSRETVKYDVYPNVAEALASFGTLRGLDILAELRKSISKDVATILLHYFLNLSSIIRHENFIGAGGSGTYYLFYVTSSAPFAGLHHDICFSISHDVAFHIYVIVPGVHIFYTCARL